MGWKQFFSSYLSPGGLCGITLSDWLRLLADNRFAVDPPYWPRAAMVTGVSLGNSVFRRYENWRYGAAIAAARPQPPLFVLGMWRSGTTHLHNLLARDVRFAYPNYVDIFFPHTLLSTGWLTGYILATLLPQTRPHDNVRLAINEPMEDEFALSALTQLSFTLMWAFPRNGHKYERFLTFRSASREEILRWQKALKGLVQKLTYKYGRPLVLKSPEHTARIKLLLEAFPDARFVHIHRNPYHVFRSSLQGIQKLMNWLTLQRVERAGLQEKTLRYNAEIYDAYFEQRHLIPPGRLVDLSYEDLVADPLGQLRKIYGGLGLGNCDEAVPAWESYLASIQGYETNRYSDSEPEWKNQVASRYRRCFEEWGYAV